MNVLFVDDHVACANMFADIAEGMGHRACVAHDGASALRRCSEEFFDLVLLDITLPDADGRDVFAANFVAASALKKLASSRLRDTPTGREVLPCRTSMNAS